MTQHLIFIFCFPVFTFGCTSQHLLLSVFRDEMQIFLILQKCTRPSLCTAEKGGKKYFFCERARTEIHLVVYLSCSLWSLKSANASCWSRAARVALIAPRERGEWLRGIIFCVMCITVIWIQNISSWNLLGLFRNSFVSHLLFYFNMPLVGTHNYINFRCSLWEFFVFFLSSQLVSQP